MGRKRINRLKVVLAEKEMFIQLSKILGVSVDDLLWTAE